jgi:GTP pyrophosphokinase
MRKSFIELTDDVSIIILKLIEILVKLKKAEKEQSELLRNLAEECLYFYSPVAQMLGIRKIYQEMEDISFKFLYPKEYEHLQKNINVNLEHYNKKLNSMLNELTKLLKEHKVEARIQYRVKRPYSIYRKLVNQKVDLDHIYDLLALRVITKEKYDCYLTLGIVHSQWVPIDNRFRDWITFPKSNGYRSIQTTVMTPTGDKFEIQIRTEEMHEEAEYGTSAHWAYKQGTTGNMGNWLKTLHDFLENDEYFNNPFEFFSNLKNEMKRDYINVLTPKGEIISLPEGSTPVDFAFAIHTNLGFKITGAKINNKFAKLKTELKSGDVVEIISSNSENPSRDWLSFVKTNRARNRILRWFKKNERDIFIAQGRNAWEKLKEQHKKKIYGFTDEQKFKKRINEIGFDSIEDFYFAISSKSVKCSLFQLKKLYPEAFKKQVEKEKVKTKSETSLSTPKVEIEGISNILVSLAKCCNPVKGEPIIAYVTSKSEIKIHKDNCAYLKRLNPMNFKTAKWAEGDSQQIVNFKVFGNNYNKITQTISDIANSQKITINSMKKLQTKEGVALELQLIVDEVNHLNTFLTKIKNSKDISGIK